MRFTRALLTLALLAVPAAGGGRDGQLAGNWRLTIFEPGEEVTFWLLKLETKGGKLAGTLDSAEAVRDSSLQAVSVEDGVLRLTIKTAGTSFHFEGRLPKAGGKVIRGSLGRPGLMAAAELASTAAERLSDTFTLNKEILARHAGEPKAFRAALDLIREGSAHKAGADEVRDWARQTDRAAEAYGPRWHWHTALAIAEAALGQEEYAGLALNAAKRAEALLPREAGADARLRTLDVQARALKAAGKAAEAAALEGRLEKLELQTYEEHRKKALPFEPEPSAGRKAKSDRAVLVELFTGAQCQPCVAADLAFDALHRTYKGSEVVLLQYHLHIPGPDALANAATAARQKYYGDKLEGTPTLFLDGKPGPGGGGGRDDSREKYKEYRTAVQPLLETPAGAKVQASAVRQGNKVRITARVSGLDGAGDKVRLRLALVEGWVRYTGSNGLLYHHRVVRAMPGGAEGFALARDAAEQSAVVDLDALRRNLASYLDDYAKKEGPFLDAQRPMPLRDLSVVAFVQDDATGEVLQAVEAPVEAK